MRRYYNKLYRIKYFVKSKGLFIALAFSTIHQSSAQEVIPIRQVSIENSKQNYSFDYGYSFSDFNSDYTLSSSQHRINTFRLESKNQDIIDSDNNQNNPPSISAEVNEGLDLIAEKIKKADINLNNLKNLIVKKIYTSQDSSQTLATNENNDLKENTSQKPENNALLNAIDRNTKKVTSFLQKGVASWYGKDFHGKKTASGDRYNMYAYTAAHRTLPLGSYIRVTNKENNKSAVVKITDRGPYAHQRVLDLSFAAAKHLDLIVKGKGKVEIEKID